MSEIDRERTEALVKRLLETVRPTLATPPHSRDNVYVVLNAIGWLVATILTGAADRDARDFFDLALAQNLEDLAGENAPC